MRLKMYLEIQIRDLAKNLDQGCIWKLIKIKDGFGK
jgi:hypothetical protein